MELDKKIKDLAKIVSQRKTRRQLNDSDDISTKPCSNQTPRATRSRNHLSNLTSHNSSTESIQVNNSAQFFSARLSTSRKKSKISNNPLSTTPCIKSPKNFDLQDEKSLFFSKKADN